MHFRIALVALTAVAAVATVAGPGRVLAAEQPFRVIVKAYEADLRYLRLPGNSNGTLSFRPCSDCDYKTVRVSPGTRYEANGRTYELEDFRTALAALERRKTAVTVKHHLESDLITAISVISY